VKKLIVYFKHYQMSDSVARKAPSQGCKHYKVTKKKLEFPVDISVAEAYNKIYEEFGERPELEKPFGLIPFQGALGAHGFAEIIGSTVADVAEPTKEKSPQYIESELL
jgi:hypothetical protein